ncbi:hypothetical protein EON62_03835 [archaeon]|nr:MAG: hypothetical protein EON62_03835 [archaeon]
MTCKETDAEPPVEQTEFHRKLICNIEGGAGKTIQVNHLSEGIMLVSSMGAARACRTRRASCRAPRRSS